MIVTPHITKNERLEQLPVQMLRWVFQRRENAITCEVDFTADRGYEVSVVPHWNVSETAIEHFDSAPHALRRHAELASSLRESGWVVTGRGHVLDTKRHAA